MCGILIPLHISENICKTLKSLGKLRVIFNNLRNHGKSLPILGDPQKDLRDCQRCLGDFC